MKHKWERRWVLHVEDTNPHSLSAHGWLEDTSKVAKYVMSDEEYARRDNTYRSYKERRRQARGCPRCPLQAEVGDAM